MAIINYTKTSCVVSHFACGRGGGEAPRLFTCEEIHRYLSVFILNIISKKIENKYIKNSLLKMLKLLQIHFIDSDVFGYLLKALIIHYNDWQLVVL